jgi:Fic family protein
MQDIQRAMERVVDAELRFREAPLSAISESLDIDVIASSIYSTNSIEGGTLNVQETKQVLALSPTDVQTTHQRRVSNIKNAYDYIRNIAISEWQPSISDVRKIHALISAGLDTDEPRNKPGLLRDNPDGVITRVGSDEHGGIYKPPQLGLDIESLLTALLEWNKEMTSDKVSVLIRAPLIHLYFELIHPFWDGNGRVGRALEAAILHASGFSYAGFAQANFYHKNIHHYFALFNQSKKAGDTKQENPNQAFILFFLEGMFKTITQLHSRVNTLLKGVLFEAQLKTLKEQKVLNARQYAIANAILQHGSPLTTSDLKQLPWFVALYDKLATKTRSRDIIKLKALKLIEEKDGQLMIVFN